MRAFRRDALERLDLRMPGMEFASEMVIRASKAGLQIEEIPIEYHPRKGESKLNSFRDGWRHLRFLLVHSPTHLFLIPGLLLCFFGVVGMAAVLANLSFLGRAVGPARDDRRLDGHDRRSGRSWRSAWSRAPTACTISATATRCSSAGKPATGSSTACSRARCCCSPGSTIATVVLIKWLDRGLGALGEEQLAVLSLTLIVIGMQVVFTSFLISIVGLRRRTDT